MHGGLLEYDGYQCPFFEKANFTTKFFILVVLFQVIETQF